MARMTDMSKVRYNGIALPPRAGKRMAERWSEHFGPDLRYDINRNLDDWREPGADKWEVEHVFDGQWAAMDLEWLRNYGPITVDMITERSMYVPAGAPIAAPGQRTFVRTPVPGSIRVVRADDAAPVTGWSVSGQQFTGVYPYAVWVFYRCRISAYLASVSTDVPDEWEDAVGYSLKWMEA